MATVRKLGLLPQSFGNCGGMIEPISNWPPNPVVDIAFHPSYFIEGDIDMVTALYWKVRAFQVIANVTHQGESYSDTFTMRPDDQDGETSGFATETDIICGGYDWYLRSGYGNTNFVSSMGGAYVDDSDNYFVSFAIFDGQLDWYRSWYDPDRDLGTNGTWQLNFAGYSITKPLYKPQNFSGPTSVVMTATEYWPYDPDDGDGPIYDSATGAQLRDFP